MGASDLHSENLIIQGVYPVLVDMETILTPQPEEFSDPEIFPEPPARKQDFVYDLNLSLYPSSILPKFDGGRQFSILLDKRSETHQLPVIDGKKRTVLEFQDSFLDGFSQIYDRCICCREELMAVFHEFEQVSVRSLLRQSAYYGRVLEALQNPAALQSEESRRKITGRLNQYFQKHGAEHLLSIARAEENSLLEGDIPYFYAMGGGKDLMSDGNVVCRSFFKESGVENAVLRFSRADESEKSFEIGLLRRSLAVALIQEEDEPEKEGKAEQSGETAEPKESGQAEKTGHTKKTGQMGKTGESEKTKQAEKAEPTEKAGQNKKTRSAEICGVGREMAMAQADDADGERSAFPAGQGTDGTGISKRCDFRSSGASSGAVPL